MITSQLGLSAVNASFNSFANAIPSCGDKGVDEGGAVGELFCLEWRHDQHSHVLRLHRLHDAVVVLIHTESKNVGTVLYFLRGDESFQTEPRRRFRADALCYRHTAVAAAVDEGVGEIVYVVGVIVVQRLHNYAESPHEHGGTDEHEQTADESGEEYVFGKAAVYLYLMKDADTYAGSKGGVGYTVKVDKRRETQHSVECVELEEGDDIDGQAYKQACQYVQKVVLHEERAFLNPEYQHSRQQY